jgi:hypothetical protein
VSVIAALSFIYVDSVVVPHVQELGVGVDDSVPSLRDLGVVPGAKGVFEFHDAGGTKHRRNKSRHVSQNLGEGRSCCG